MTKRKIIKQILVIALWTAMATATIVLLVAAIQQKDAKKCTGLDITIKGVSNNFFVDKNDILNTISQIAGGKPAGKPIGYFDLKGMETALQKNVWVKSAQLFFDNNERLQVNVSEREPVARVFTTSGSTFYLDSSIAMLPLSDKFSARLPVFTSFPSDKKVLLAADSNLLRDIVMVSTSMQADLFYMAMIDQVDITAQRDFEMIPKFGNSVIVFGDAQNTAQKLKKMELFYKNVITKTGWNKYSEINVQYHNQIVAKRKGAAEVKADSLRTLQLMQLIAANAERLAADSVQAIAADNEHNTTSSSIIQQSIERDDRNTSSNTSEEPGPQEISNNKKPATAITGTSVTKPAPGKITVPATQRKAALQQADNKKPVIDATHPEAKKPAIIMPKPPPKKQVIKKPANDY